VEPDQHPRDRDERGGRGYHPPRRGRDRDRAAARRSGGTRSARPRPAGRHRPAARERGAVPPDGRRRPSDRVDHGRRRTRRVFQQAVVGLHRRPLRADDGGGGGRRVRPSRRRGADDGAVRRGAADGRDLPRRAPHPLEGRRLPLVRSAWRALPRSGHRRDRPLVRRLGGHPRPQARRGGAARERGAAGVFAQARRRAAAAI
jgi:hypothetical protein